MSVVPHELALLTTVEMSRADAMTISGEGREGDGIPGFHLMERAGGAVASVAADMVARQEARLKAEEEGVSGSGFGSAFGVGSDDDAVTVHVLCGLGNNGGDGFVAARDLIVEGFEVHVWVLGDVATLKGDAALAYEAYAETGRGTDVLTADTLRDALGGFDVVVDAVLGAGLDRSVEGELTAVVSVVNDCPALVLSVDLPSGLNGSTGQVMGVSFQADRTVTFFCKKPGHYLLPGRALCGEVDCVDIGIEAEVLDRIQPMTMLNAPELFLTSWSPPELEAHKYKRGHAVVLGGPGQSSGAGRLAAVSALRSGAGLVTIGFPASALVVYASHLTSVMVRPLASFDEAVEFIAGEKIASILIGPGYSLGDHTKQMVREVLYHRAAVVLDADALSVFAGEPESLFEMIRKHAGEVVLTPHDGEFARLFPDLVSADKLSRARQAAKRSGAVVVLKGADTVIASPDGRAAINANGTAWLATAGSGDVLAGLVTGFLAQGLPAFEGAAMAVWTHGQAGCEAGPGLIAEDLPLALPAVFAALVEKTTCRIV